MIVIKEVQYSGQKNSVKGIWVYGENQKIEWVLNQKKADMSCHMKTYYATMKFENYNQMMERVAEYM